MIIKNIIDEDFINYKKAAMFIAFPYCSFKCEKECGIHCCQNSELATSPDINITYEKIINRYINNPITSAIVMGGLEPFDSWNDLYNLIIGFRKFIQDDIVIYTGYNKEEIKEKIEKLVPLNNIIIKYGRFIPNSVSHFDSILGITLNSENQYAEKIC